MERLLEKTTVAVMAAATTTVAEAEKILERINMLVSIVVLVLSGIFGVYWYIFVSYAALNVLDWITGWMKARKTKTESSKVGFRGILKKLGYWIIIAIAFMVPAIFINIGNELLGINLSFTMFLGWFTLITLEINEIRSILENLTELGYKIPAVLTQGLEVAEKLLNNKIDETLKH